MNPDNVFQKNQNPIDAFLKSIDVAKVDANGQATGTTGGAVHMWDDQTARYNELLGASQGQVQPGQAPAGNAFLQPTGTNTPAAAPMAANAFLGGANGPSSATPAAPTGWINKAPGTPQANQDGSTPMIGRANPAPIQTGATPLSSFGKQVLNSPTPISRDGAIFSGEGGKLSITQDPNTIPAQDPAGGGMTLSPGAGAILARGVTQFTGPDANNQFLKAIDAGTYDTQPIAGATPEEVAALALTNAKARAEAKAALPRMALPNTGNSGVDAARNNTFLKTMEGSLGQVDALAGKASKNTPEVVTLGGVKYARLGNSMQVIPDQTAPQKTLVAGTTRVLEPKKGVKINAEWDGKDWFDSTTGAQVWITPRDQYSVPTGKPELNPTLMGDAPATDSLDALGATAPAKDGKDKKTDKKRVQLKLSDLL